MKGGSVDLGLPVAPAPTAASTVRLGTRGSALAMAQSEQVAQGLRGAGRAVELVIVQTAGDRRAPDTAWGEGAFVAALEQALLGGEVDAAVHSAKDLPTAEDMRLVIAAYLPRADPRDALVCRERGTTLAELPLAARVGTDSPRRTGFLLAQRPDLEVHPLNGNVDTRLRRLDEGESDALVLAVAGLARLGREERIDELLDPTVVPPAPGQGAIAVQVRRDDRRALEEISRLDHVLTRIAVEAERAFLRAAGGGCRAPIGALATVSGDLLTLRGAYVRPDGGSVLRGEVSGPASDPVRLGIELAARLGSRPRSTSPRPHRVLVTRAADQAQATMDALRARGIDPMLVPAIEIGPVPAGGPLDDALGRIASYDWVVLTSTNGVAALVGAAQRLHGELRGPHWAAVGGATARALTDAGIGIDFQPGRSTGANLAEDMPLEPGQRILTVRGDLAGSDLPERLRERGAVVEEVVAYLTEEAPEASRSLLSAALEDPPPDAVIFSSGSTVRGLLALCPPEQREALARLPAVCIGPRTAEVAREHGFTVASESASPAPGPVADACAALSEDLAP